MSNHPAPDDFNGQCRARIRRYEGYEHKVYIDTKGHPTVGIGFNLDRPDAPALLKAQKLDYAKVRAGTQTLTDAQIAALFQHDLQNVLAEAPKAVKNFAALSGPRRFVIVDMIFNLGVAGFKDFKKAIAAIQHDNFAEAAAQMKDSDWYTQVGHRSVEDCAMMKTGHWGPLN